MITQMTLQWRNGFGLFCHVHHQPDAGRALCIQLVYPRYLLEELFPCCVWYLEPLCSSPNANTSTFVFSLSLPPRVVWCQQTRMKKKKKKDGNLLGKNPSLTVFVDPTQRPHHCITSCRLLSLLCSRQSWQEQTCLCSTGCHICCQCWVSAYGSPGTLAAVGLYVTALDKWNCPWRNVFPGRAFCSERKEFKRWEGSEMRVGFPPRGVLRGTPEQNTAAQELSAAAGPREEFTRWGPGNGETPRNSECPPNKQTQQELRWASDVLILCAELNRTRSVTPCPPSCMSPSWSSKKEKTNVFLFSPLSFFFFLFKWLPPKLAEELRSSCTIRNYFYLIKKMYPFKMRVAEWRLELLVLHRVLLSTCGSLHW